MDLNKAMVIGRLTRDPEVRTTPNGATVASFAVATNFVWTNQAGQKQEQVEYHNIVAWRKLAEIVGQYMKKGSKVYVEGRLQTRSWDGNDGTKKNRTEIVADNIIMLDSKGSGGQAPAPAAESTPASEPAIQIDDSDIPF
ncbi:MAG TPA: single-stranded DNA-binding protein [Patescibacteria group bacterium]|jgi:single-strand DNA-binding protein|nr:single-stranded DNA-binding protein [Patescibacteria group bacterium]